MEIYIIFLGTLQKKKKGGGETVKEGRGLKTLTHKKNIDCT